MKYYIHHSDGAYAITDAAFCPDMAIDVPDHLVRMIERHADEGRVIHDALRELDNEAHRRRGATGSCPWCARLDEATKSKRKKTR